MFNAKLSNAERAAVRSNIAKAKIGVPLKGKTAKFSPDHHNNVEAFFRDPRGVIHYALGLTRFVNANQHLFNPDDLKWRLSKSGLPTYCRASNGLSRLYSGFRNTWKGWMLVSNREGREQFDLIGRNTLETK